MSMSDARNKVLQLVQQGLLESAWSLMIRRGVTPDTRLLNGPIDGCLERAAWLKRKGDIRASFLFQRRASALTILRDSGRLSGAVIPSTVLPEGYCGKILLAFVEGDLIPGRTFLRSGDDWHREILRSFEEEVCDYGFENVHVSPLGGAFAEFRPDGSIVLWGASEEFGRCRKEDALKLVRTAYPDRAVHWSGGPGS